VDWKSTDALRCRAIVAVVEPADVRRHDGPPDRRRHDGARDRRVLRSRARCDRGTRVESSRWRIPRRRRRWRRDRFTTASWCRSATISRCSAARERTRKPERVEQRNDDRRHESRLSKNVGNLNRHNTDEVHGRDRRGNRVARVPEEDQGQVRAAVEVCERPGEHERRSRNVSADRL